MRIIILFSKYFTGRLRSSEGLYHCLLCTAHFEKIRQNFSPPRRSAAQHGLCTSNLLPTPACVVNPRRACFFAINSFTSHLLYTSCYAMLALMHQPLNLQYLVCVSVCVSVCVCVCVRVCVCLLLNISLFTCLCHKRY